MILHWYDLTCPFCYLAQSRNAALEQGGLPGGRDIGDPGVIVALAADCGVDAGEEGWRSGAALQRLETSEESGRAAGVRGTPAWKIGDRLLVGLQPAAALGKVGRAGA